MSIVILYWSLQQELLWILKGPLLGRRDIENRCAVATIPAFDGRHDVSKMESAPDHRDPGSDYVMFKFFLDSRTA